MNNKQKVLVAIVAVAIVAAGSYFFLGSSKKEVKKIDLKNQASEGFPLANEGPVSPISGLSCENWNQRPIAFMQPADVPARPLSGLSQADMVFEMSAVYGGITRLMGVYGCNRPEEIGSLRSARHDFVHIAKSLDAIYVHWGRADIEQFKEVLNSGIIDDMNCNNDAGRSAGQYCYRNLNLERGVDTGYAKFTEILEGIKTFEYRMEGNKFSGYPHQGEAPIDQRPNAGHLRVGYAKPYDAEYDYDKASNSYFRTWGGIADTDRNNKQRIAPKNVVVLIADAAPIKVGEQYVNVQIGDPWYDTLDSGQAHYYFNGQQTEGTWKKDKSQIDSKLLFYDGNGQEVKFVPGQIWVDIIDSGQALKWVSS